VELVVRVGAGVAEYVESESSSAASRTIDNVSAREEVSSARSLLGFSGAWLRAGALRGGNRQSPGPS